MLYKLIESKRGEYIGQDGKHYDLSSCKFAYCLLDEGILGRDTECGFDEFENDEAAIEHYKITLIKADEAPQTSEN